MAEKKLTQEEKEERKELIARDTRNILLGGLMSMISSLTTLIIVQNYIVPKTVSSYIREQQKLPSGQPLPDHTRSIREWKPLSYIPSADDI